MDGDSRTIGAVMTLMMVINDNTFSSLSLSLFSERTCGVRCLAEPAKLTGGAGAGLAVHCPPGCCCCFSSCPGAQLVPPV